MMLSILLVAFAVFYGGLISAFATGLRRVLDRDAFHPGATDFPAISVVIAARDEEEHIHACVESVLRCGDSIAEIMVVDDHSTDRTADMVREFAGRSQGPPVRLIQLSEVLPGRGGKSLAIRAGIEAASGEVILTTDADCRVEPGWASSMGRRFEPGVEFVAGPVRFDPLDGWTDRLQALEFAGLIGIGAGAIGIGWPNMCNSANIAYTRTAALARRPSADGRTPDDEVMLQELHRRDPNSVRFCSAREAVVSTHASGSLSQFLEQRRRWAGTGARYPSLPLVLAIGAIYVFYVLLIVASGMVVSGATAVLPQLVLASLIKVASEAWLLTTALSAFATPSLMRYFLPAQLLQIPYVVLIGLAGVLGNVSWKGRPT